MTTHFDEVGAAALEESKVQLRQKLSKISSEFANHGASHGTAMYIEYQKTSQDHIYALAEQLVAELSNFDVHHTPYKKEDFISAKKIVEDFEIFCVQVYDDKVRTGNAFTTPPPWETSRRKSALRRALLLIEGRRTEFISKTSFWKKLHIAFLENLSSNLIRWIFLILAFLFGYISNEIIQAVSQFALFQ